MTLLEDVEKVLEYMKSLGLSQLEAVAVAQYVHETLKYNSLKEDLSEEIKNDILEELKKLKKDSKN